MKYISTRGEGGRLPFCDILLGGLAPDGGLYMPESYPQISAETLESWRNLPYAELAFEIMRLYIDDIPENVLKHILQKTYQADIFGTDKITPVKKLVKNTYLLCLSNGPTLAFKDIAMQFLGNMFEYVLAQRGQQLNILGATSGDTGSAAEYAMRGKKGIRVLMTSPHGRMSDYQQAQMFSLQDLNIHNAAIPGVFDTCQDIVKAISNDAQFKKDKKIGAVNSINWGRILAQVVYYFSAYLQTAKTPGQKINFTVPSGNFGNVCAGHVARMMGLPINKLVVATNENDVLHEFFQTGRYSPRSVENTLETTSPSMDISKASNLERFVFDLVGRDSLRLRDIFEIKINTASGWTANTGDTLQINQYGFTSGRSMHSQRLKTIRTVFDTSGFFVDPHTADGILVAHDFLEKTPELLTEPMIVLETALPEKFYNTMVSALGSDMPPPSAETSLLLKKPRRFEVLDADVQAVKNWITKIVN